jgi:hypothetical protein
MNESDIRALALFFFFALLDDRKAVDLAIAALGVCQEKKKRYPNMKNSVIVVAATSEIWEEVHLKLKRGLPNTSLESGWIVLRTWTWVPGVSFKKMRHPMNF